MATVGAAAAAILVAGCGGSDFENTARPAVTLQLSGVIAKDQVTVSPSRNLGAGPFAITLSNQTDQRHTVKIEGGTITQPPQPVDPGDTVTIKRTLDPGTYQVSAGSEQAVPKEIKPATLEIGAARPDSNGDLMLP
jgi:ribosomal 50S subunit-recycling heat shock protein